MSSTTRIKALESALDVLCRIPTNGSIGLAELSQKTGMTKSAIYKILVTFADFGFVIQDHITKEYSLGPAIIAIGAKTLSNIDIRAIVRPYLHMLSKEFNENSMLMIHQGTEALIVEYCEAEVPVRLSMQLGQRHELYYGAAPKVILAYQNKEEQDFLISQFSFKKYTSETIGNKKQLYAALKTIRENGYCYSGGEFDNNGIGIAVPLFSNDLTVENSIAMNVPMFRLKEAPISDMVHKMKEYSVMISEKLGADRSTVENLLRLHE